MKTDEEIGKEAGEEVRARTLKLLNEKGPKLEKVLERLNEELDAKETKTIKAKGAITEDNLPEGFRLVANTGLLMYDDEEMYGTGDCIIQHDIVAHSPRLTAIKVALELHDAMPKTGVEKAAETIEDVLREIHAGRGNL